MSTTASAAIASSRPMGPTSSPVLAFTLTASIGIPSNSATLARIAGLCGASLGRWAKTVQSRLTTRQPAAVTRSSARVSKIAESIPAYAAFPVAPPRLADAGLVNTITSQTGFALNGKLTTSFYNELATLKENLIQDAVKRADQAIKDIAKRDGYTIVYSMPGSAVYGANDLTAAVTKALDANN